MTRPKSLTTLVGITMTLLFTILAGLMLYLWEYEELREARSRIQKTRDTYIAVQKNTIKTQVKQTVDYIKHKKSLAEKRVRSEVKSRTNEAYETALYIYNSHKDNTPLEQIKKRVYDALYAAAWDDGKGYYFAEDMIGTELINRNNPDLEGKNLMNVQDSRGTYIMKEILSVVRSPEKEGFCSYYWNKPEYPGILVPKISYVKYFEPFDWVIGNGKYIVDEEEKIKQEVLERLEQIRYGKDGYIFAGTWDGLSLSGPYKGENMLHITDPTGLKIVKKLIEAAKSGSGFVEYIAPKYKGQAPAAKISYAEAVQEWKWYIGTGLHIDEIETVIAERQLEMKESIRSRAVKGLLLLVFFIFFSSLIIWFFSKRIKINLSIFDEFFRQAAKQALPIEKDKVSFTEFQSLAASANQMSRERIKSEKALRDSEKKYRQLFNNAPAGIYEINFPTGRFINVNDVMCSFTGYTESELVKMAPIDLLNSDSKTRYEERQKKLLSGKKIPESIEVEMINKDGQTLFILLTCDFVYRGKELKGARVVAHDISELKIATEEKLNAQRIAGEQKKLALVGQIAGKMAHDFNNILGIIMGNTQLLMTNCSDDEDKRKLDLIFRQTLRGRNLTKNLVAFAKDQEPSQKYFSLSEKIDLVINLMRKDLEGIKLVKSDDPDVPDLLADPGMIEHALVNLLQNSIHATSKVESAKITLRTYCADEQICFEIEDNGCGIPEEHIEHIYEPSFTLKGSKDTYGSYKGSIKGTGYGMANVKKYIGLHNGQININSKFGSGTKFKICLPVIKKELTDQEKVELKNTPLHYDKYILIVEDEPEISDVQYNILTQEPCRHKVDIAGNGKMAMDLFSRNRYDLVSLDYILPGKLNGFDLYNHIRKKNKTIPVLFISGNIEFLESIRDLKTNDKLVDHVSKPCPNREYIGAVNDLLGKKI